MLLLKFIVITAVFLVLSGSDAKSFAKNKNKNNTKNKTKNKDKVKDKGKDNDDSDKNNNENNDDTDYDTQQNDTLPIGSDEDMNQEQNVTFSIANLGRSFNSIEEYTINRKSILFREAAMAVGSDIGLSALEIEAEKVLMLAKSDEYQEGFLSPRRFPPSKHLFEVLNKINKSKLFKIISAMPKGALLHTHSSAMGSTDFLIELTRRDNLWACNAAWRGLNIIGFQFSKSTPKTILKEQCSWTKISDLKNTNGNQQVENYLRDHFSLYPKTNYADNNEVWHDFEAIFDRLSGLLSYAPARKDYFKNALEEFLKDNVQYVEIRTGLTIMYDLEGTNYKAEDTVRMYQEIVKQFKKDNPSFLGCKLIISAYRGKRDSQLDEYIQAFYDIQKKFPDFIAGFDLVGQEETGRPLIDMAPKLLDMRRRGVRFFFHAGETNWYGTKVDENLVDAVLLGTKRIGHGYAITKHPVVLQMLKENDIAIEINPISNQVLRLVGDLRNHPAAYLFAENYPVVVSSDDPSFWKCKPLSHDFYIAFLGIASSHANLKFLKKLALNSLQYSAMSDAEKNEAKLWWNTKWLEFVTNLANQ